MNQVDAPVHRFLHLSDIHCTDRHGAGVFDLDCDLRRAICDDVRTFREDRGPFTGVLITGDIAFAASTDEYEKASLWIEELCRIIDAPRDQIYTIPGNHDVDRLAGEEPAIAAFRRELRGCKPVQVDDILRTWLSDANPSNTLLYRPLANYNVFAARHGCDIQPGALFWDRTGLPLGLGYTLSIRGLTSVFCSDGSDDNGAYKLAVGQAQAFMPVERKMRRTRSLGPETRPSTGTWP